MKRVMAQGTFDVLHPGHLHYLRESARLGDELVVVIGRDEKLKDRKDLLFDEETRVELVDALEMVDTARLGAEGDIYDILDIASPDVVTLGYDQPFDEAEVRANYEERGHSDIELERVSRYEAADDETVSSTTIKERIKELHGDEYFFNLVDN